MGSQCHYSMALGCDFRSRTGYLFVCCSVFFFLFLSFSFLSISSSIPCFLCLLIARLNTAGSPITIAFGYRHSHWLSDTPGRSRITTNITNIPVRKYLFFLQRSPKTLTRRTRECRWLAQLLSGLPLAGLIPLRNRTSEWESKSFFAIFLSTAATAATTTTTTTYTCLLAPYHCYLFQSLQFLVSAIANVLSIETAAAC